MDFAPDRKLNPFALFVLSAIALYLLAYAADRWGTVEGYFWASGALLVLYLAFVPALLLLYRVKPERIGVRGLLGWFWLRRVKEVSIEPFQITLRVMAMGTPGSLYGLFNVQPFGNIRVYGSKTTGEGVLLTLKDGKKILLTPKDPQAFVDYLKKQGFPVKKQARS